MLSLSISPSHVTGLNNLQNPTKICSYLHHFLSSCSSIKTTVTHLQPNGYLCSVSTLKPLRRKPQQQQIISSADSSNSSQPGASAPNVYVGYPIYKGKAVLSVEPRPPEFSPMDSGAFKLIKEGVVLLQFAPAVGVQQYDWSRKQIFSLSATEIGSLICLGEKDSCEFIHDPNKGRSDEGRVMKVLKVEPLPDGFGHFFNLSVQNKPLNLDESICVPITKAEFAVLVSTFNFVVPYLLGWHTSTNTFKPDNASRRKTRNRANPRLGAELEWSR